MDEIVQWEPNHATIDDVPGWREAIGSLVTNANNLMANHPASNQEQPISQLLQAVVQANDDIQIKKCWPMAIVKKDVRFDPSLSKFVYTNKFNRNTVLKPDQVRQCVRGRLKGHTSGCPVRRQNLELYINTLSQEDIERHGMFELLEIVEE